MRIARIEARTCLTTFPSELSPAWSPGHTWGEVQTTVYRVVTRDGLIGIGAGSGSPRLVHDVVAPLLIGQDATHVGAIVRQIRNCGLGAAALPIAVGIEIALWDLIGQAANLPLYRLWGAHTDRIRAYASLVEVRSPEQRAEDALSLLEQGYRAVKLRIHQETLKEDVAQVEGVRRAVGDRMAIMVDANQAQEPGTPGSDRGLTWSYQRALETSRALADLDVTWLEEPLGRYDFDHQARLSRESPVAIAGGEGNVGLHEFRLLIDKGCYAIPQPDVMVAGGVLTMRKILHYAEMHHLQCVPHHGGNGVGVALHLHLSASSQNSPYVELLQEVPQLSVGTFQGLLREPLLPNADGDVVMPSAPGLGVALRDDLHWID